MSILREGLSSSGRRAGLIGVALMMAAGAAMGADIAVPGDVATIQGAIDIAQAGDVIVVSPGVYQETLQFGSKAITLRSSEGAGVTTIDAGGIAAFAVRVHGVSGGEAVLSGFTITGGLGALGGAHPTGGGIWISNSTARIEGVVVTGNSNIFGGGLRAEGSTVTVSDSLFMENEALSGGAVSTAGGNVTIERTVMENNRATNNGGGLAGQGGHLTLREVELRENGCGQLGGGLWLNHVNINASQLLVERNGFAEVLSGSIQFDTLAGGGVYTSNTSGRIDRSRFISNRGAYGGAFYIAGDGTLEIVNTVMAGSLAAIGGGVYCNSSSPRITNCTIVNNPWALFTTYNAFPVVRNSILSGNSGTGSNEIGGNGLTQISNSIVNGPVWNTNIGGGVIQMHPMLDADFAPMAGSPAIDAGDNSAVPTGVTLDLPGNARFVDDPETADTGIGESPIVDLGAIEFGASTATAECAPDMIEDGVLDFFDVVAFISMWQARNPRADMNGDSQHDFFDVLIYLEMFSNGCP